MTTYYVSSQIGSDNGAGTSASAPLATLQAAANLVRPGDTVEVMNGTYTGPSQGAVVDITTSGTASAPIIFQAAPGQTPIIDTTDCWQGIYVQASYIVVNGFTVVGNAANYTYAQAMALYNTGDALLNSTGIAVNSPGGGVVPNHIIIENNTVYNQGEAGITSENADYIQYLDNVAYNNAHWSPYGGSGIMIGASVNSDTNPGIHDVISGNLSYNNTELVPEYRAQAITDGEGIILDTNYGSGAADPTYVGQFLVENNTTYGNSGPGIEAFLTNNAIITGNTSYGDVTNARMASNGEPEIWNIQSTNVTLTNNDTTAPSSTPAPPTTGTPPSAPKISSFSPDTGLAGDGITSANKLDLKGTADANSTVTVYDGATKLGTTTASSTGSWDYVTGVLTDAKHMLTATETNSSDQTSVASAPLAVTVDTRAPAAPVVASDSVVNTNHVQLSGAAEANSSVTLYNGSTLVGTGTASSSGEWSITTSALSNGMPTLTAKAADVAGNVSAASQPTDPVIPGTPAAPAPPPAAPKIISLSPDSGVVGDHITNDDAPTLNGTALANSSVAVYDSTAKVGAATVNGSGQWTLSTTSLSDGTHNLTATDTDSSGHISGSSSAFAVTIDTHAPGAPTLAAYSQAGATVAGITSRNDLVLKGTAEAASTIDVFDGSKQIGTATTNSAGAWSYDTGQLANGNHSFTAVAIDAAGNVSPASAAKMETVTTPALTATTPAPFDFTGLRHHHRNDTAAPTSTAEANSHVKLYDGIHSAALDFNAVSTLANFKLASDGSGAGATNNVTPKIMHDPGVTALDQQLALFSQHMASAFPSSAFGSDNASIAGAAELLGALQSQIAQPVANKHHT
jgi:hypothetical protein